MRRIRSRPNDNNNNNINTNNDTTTTSNNTSNNNNNDSHSPSHSHNHSNSTANLPTNIVGFRGFDSSIILNLKGWNSQTRREFPGKFESSNLSRDNVSREIGRRVLVTDVNQLYTGLRQWCTPEAYIQKAAEERRCVITPSPPIKTFPVKSS